MLLLRLLLGSVYLCLGFGLLGFPVDSRADAVLLRFRPPPQSGVVGYKMYLAPATTGAITNAPVDIGARAPDSTGIASYSIGNLDPARSYSVELTAYDAKGTESIRSNRLTVEPRLETLGSVLWQSNFDQYAPGVHVPGFTDLAGDTVTTSGTNIFSVAYRSDGSRSYWSGSDSGAVASQYTGAEAAGWGSYEISGRLRTDSGAVEGGIGARAVSGRYFELGQTPDRAWALARVNEPDLTCAPGPALGVTQSIARWYSFRYRVTRALGLTRLRAKVWAQNTSEPSWQADCWTKIASRLDSGSFLLMRGGSGGVYFDDLVVTSVVGTLDPIPPQ
jgi:hypothetical protein